MLTHLFVLLLVFSMPAQPVQSMTLAVFNDGEACKMAAGQFVEALKADPNRPPITALSVGCVPVDLPVTPPDPQPKGSI